MKTYRHLAGRAPAFMTAAMTLLIAAVTPVRRRLPGVVGFMCLVGSIAPANAATPVVPLVTAHQHWEHQWFVWLPRHPVYESVEVMSIDSAGDYFRVVWVFFTDAPPAAREFMIHMNPDEPVARGEVVSEPVEGGRRLTWRLHSPPWAVNYPFESIIQSNGDGHALQIRSLSR